MVKIAGATPGAGAVRPINSPEPLRVERDACGYPALLIQGKDRLEVASVEDIWRIEDEWWRGRPVSRTYFQVLAADGRRTTLFLDRTTKCWFKQTYG